MSHSSVHSADSLITHLRKKYCQNSQTTKRKTSEYKAKRKSSKLSNHRWHHKSKTKTSLQRRSQSFNLSNDRYRKFEKSYRKKSRSSSYRNENSSRKKYRESYRRTKSSSREYPYIDLCSNSSCMNRHIADQNQSDYNSGAATNGESSDRSETLYSSSDPNPYEPTDHSSDAIEPIVDSPSELSSQSILMSDDAVFNPEVLAGRGARGKLSHFAVSIIGNQAYDPVANDVSYAVVNEAGEKTWMLTSKLNKGRVTDLMKLSYHHHNDMEKRMREAECRAKGYVSPYGKRPIILGQDRLTNAQYKRLKRKIMLYEKSIIPKKVLD